MIDKIADPVRIKFCLSHIQDGGDKLVIKLMIFYQTVKKRIRASGHGKSVIK